MGARRRLRLGVAPRVTPIVAVVAALGCASEAPIFPLRPPLATDTDAAPVTLRCHPAPSAKDPRHATCAPEPYVSPLYWDGADNLLFRPLSDSLRVRTNGESVDVNSFDEVPNSTWFSNRIGARAVSVDELRSAGCRAKDLLDPEHATDGSWVIDKGKEEGASPGFQMRVPGQGKYLVKLEDTKVRIEGQTAASVIGMAIFHSIGYFTPCEQTLYVKPSLFTLRPGLRSRANFSDWKDLDRAELDRMLAATSRRGGRYRISASAWIPGYSIGPARFVGTRDDDPNDVVPHEDRRELRAMRLADAWFDRWDAREENSLDTWMTDAGKGAPPDASPGHVIHYQLDTSESLGGEQAWEPISRRLGYSYMLDWGDIGSDFVTFGMRTRPWDGLSRVRGFERFGFMDVAHFDPEGWKAEYPNPAFSRMTERDGAWMARVLAHFTRAHVRALAEIGDFTDPRDTDYLARVLEGRLERILERYLLRLSPIAHLVVEDRDTLCGTDLAAWRRMRPASAFRYTAWSSRGTSLAVEPGEGGRVCVKLRHADLPRDVPDDAPERYLRVALSNGVAKGALVAHLYDLGPGRGFVVVGLERPL